MNHHQNIRYRAKWAAVPEDESERTENLDWTHRRFLWVLRACKRWMSRQQLQRALEETTPQVGWRGSRIREMASKLGQRGLVRRDAYGQYQARGKASYGLQKGGVWMDGVEDGESGGK